MMAGNFPAPRKDGIKQEVKESASPYNITSSFLNNYSNLHTWEVYVDVVAHPWTTIGETQDRLGYYDGKKSNLRHRILISDVFRIFTVFKVFRKEGYRFIATDRVPRMSTATHQERKFGSDGLPRVQPKSNATMPGYGRPDCGGDGE